VKLKTAMVLAAGRGVRMRPLTLDRPKPLVTVAGKLLIDYSIDALKRAGVERIVVNTHHFSEQMAAWARTRKDEGIVLSDESDLLLDTGGGVVKALPLLGHEPFVVINSDSFWRDGPEPALARLAAAFDPEKMDALLLLSSHNQAVGFEGPGDFHMDALGRLRRRGSDPTAPFIFAGCHILDPRLLENAPKGPFSMNFAWDKALADGRLHGLRHDGPWLHVGTPEAIPIAEEALEAL
jgi:N-acetyl-alpha-D-muramate 1-phosphate uridylyltransferase